MIRFGAVEPEGEIVYDNNACQIKINSGELTRGRLSLTSSDICFTRHDSQNGFMIPWEKVTVQAITQAPNRCIYFMIDCSWPGNEPAEAYQNNGNGIHVDEGDEATNGSEDEGNDSEGSLQELTEFHVIPDNSDDVDELYYIMTKYPENPPMDDSSDDDFFDGDNIEQMNINDDDERFADAE